MSKTIYEILEETNPILLRTQKNLLYDYFRNN